MKTISIVIAVCLSASVLGCAGRYEKENDPSVSFNAHGGNYGSGAEIGVNMGPGAQQKDMPPMCCGQPPMEGKQPGPPPKGFRNKIQAAKAVLEKINGVYVVQGTSETQTGKTYDAIQPDQSAVVVKINGELNLSETVITKKGGTEDEESAGFYGINSAVLVIGRSSLNMDKTAVTTDAAGANAVVAVGKRAEININGIDIKTSANSSRGLHATREGSITAKDVRISTLGAHSAAIATDRGGGTVTVENGTLKTEGAGSPLIYSTGDISVKSVVGESKGAECAVVEGKNSVSITDSNMTCYKRNGVMLYQSFSGDSEIGESSFIMNGGSIRSYEGAVFYTTNTRAEFIVKHVTIENYDNGNTLFRASGDRWGQEGRNGSDADFTLTDTNAAGNILCDAISSVKIYLKGAAFWTGTANSDKTAGFISLSLGKEAKWNLTADSYLTELRDDDKTLANINSNGFNIYYDGNNSMNDWIGGKEMELKGGGKLLPVF